MRFVALILAPTPVPAALPAVAIRLAAGGVFVGFGQSKFVHHAKEARAFDRYGLPGLFVFMLIPFAFNGPPVGMMLGRLTGLRDSRVLGVVLAALTTTTIAWTVLTALVIDAAHKVNPLVPSAIALGISAIVLTITLLDARREHRRERAATAAAASDTPPPPTPP